MFQQQQTRTETIQATPSILMNFDAPQQKADKEIAELELTVETQKVFEII